MTSESHLPLANRLRLMTDDELFAVEGLMSLSKQTDEDRMLIAEKHARGLPVEALGSQFQESRPRGISLDDLTCSGAYGLAAVRAGVRAGFSAGLLAGAAVDVAGSVGGGVGAIHANLHAGLPAGVTGSVAGGASGGAGAVPGGVAGSVGDDSGRGTAVRPGENAASEASSSAGDQNEPGDGSLPQPRSRRERMQERDHSKPDAWCGICRLQFENKRTLENHNRVKHIGTRCYWPGCNFQTSTEDELLTHLKDHNSRAAADAGMPGEQTVCFWPGCRRQQQPHALKSNVGREICRHQTRAKIDAETA
ncbi:hypothetical protein DL769_007948 [Monosporascus sp. CRB-8-3]|nr:hypothetical protein DL769_007948 [Monosporascus sp. CRB-8-3]